MSTAESTLDKCVRINLQGKTTGSVSRDAYVVNIEDGQDGMLVAKCPELRVVTQGNNESDVQRNVMEAIVLMREELGKDKEFSIDVRRTT